MATFIERLRVENPVLTRELRTRMRGTRAFWVLFGYVAVLSLILFFTYLSWWQSQGGRLGSGGSGAFTVGKTFYSVLFTVQALLVGIITPALTSGGISIEKEQRTYDLLSLTLLPRRSIVVGKLMAAVAFVALLLTSSLPLVSLGFLLGGISPAQVAGAYFLLLVSAFLYGAVGIACSAIARNTTTANSMAYSLILLMFFATLPLTLTSSAGFFGAPGTGRGSFGLVALNPLGAVVAGSTTETYFGYSVPAWLTGLVLNGLLGVILALVAVHHLGMPRSDRSGLLRLLTAVLVALLAVGVYGVFLPGNSPIFGSTFAVTSVVTVVMLPLSLLPLFATGSGLPEQGGLLSFFDPRRLRKGEAPSGLLFTFLLAALCGLILYLGLRFGPNNGANAVASNLVMARRLLILTFATLWAFGSLGLFLSALTRGRWSAFSLLAALMVLTYLLPTSALSRRSVVPRGGATARDNVMYLTPLVAAVELGDAGTHRSLWKETLDPARMAFGATPLYRATPVVYGIMGLLFFTGAGIVHARRGSGKQSEITPRP